MSALYERIAHDKRPKYVKETYKRDLNMSKRPIKEMIRDLNMSKRPTKVTHENCT